MSKELTGSNELNKSKKKIAVLISGFSRSLLHNWPLVRQSLLESTNCSMDIFLHWTDQEQQLDSYSNRSSLTEVIDCLQPIAYLVEQEPDLSLVTNSTYHRNSWLMWYKIYQVNQLKKHREQLSGDKYDYVIRWRPDITLLENSQLVFQKIFREIDQLDELKTIWLPDRFQEAYSRSEATEEALVLNDQLALGNSESLDVYCDLFLELINKPKKNQLVSETENEYQPQREQEKQFVPSDSGGINFPPPQKSSELLYQYLHQTNDKNKTTQKKLTIHKFSLNYKLTLSLCHVIGIMGDSGSGKSTLSKILAPLFGLEALTLECDRYHKWERHDPHWQQITHLHPESNHLDQMNQDLYKLKVGSDIYCVDYDHCTGKFTNSNEIKSQDHVILCGLHTFYNQSQMLNLKIFTAPETDLKYFWKMQRDILERKYDKEKVLANIQKRKQDYDQFIDPWRQEADLILNFRSRDLIDFNQLERKPNIYLRIYFRKEINLISLLNFFEQIQYSLQISYCQSFNYIDFLEKSFSVCQLMKFLDESVITNASNIRSRPALVQQDLQSGYNGIIQLVVLYCYQFGNQKRPASTFEYGQK